MTTLGEKLREAIEKRSVIQTTLNAWDAHEDQIRKPQQEKQMANANPVVKHAEDAPYFSVTNNVVRATFDAIKNAPMMKRLEYMEMLKLNGYKEASVSSVISQLTKAGQVVRNENGNYRVTCDEYTPIKQPKKKPRVVVLDKAPEPKPRQIVIVKKPKAKGHGIAALTPDTGDNNLPNVEKFDMGKFTHHAARGFHPSAIVDGLTVLHARELYDYLKKIFGGN